MADKNQAGEAAWPLTLKLVSGRLFLGENDEISGCGAAVNLDTICLVRTMVPQAGWLMEVLSETPK
jgi:hypothetical protein